MGRFILRAINAIFWVFIVVLVLSGLSYVLTPPISAASPEAFNNDYGRAVLSFHREYAQPVVRSVITRVQAFFMTVAGLRGTVVIDQSLQTALTIITALPLLGLAYYGWTLVRAFLVEGTLLAIIFKLGRDFLNLFKAPYTTGILLMMAYLAYTALFKALTIDLTTTVFVTIALIIGVLVAMTLLQKKLENNRFIFYAIVILFVIVLLGIILPPELAQPLIPEQRSFSITGEVNSFDDFWAAFGSLLAYMASGFINWAINTLSGLLPIAVVDVLARIILTIILATRVSGFGHSSPAGRKI